MYRKGMHLASRTTCGWGTLCLRGKQIKVKWNEKRCFPTVALGEVGGGKPFNHVL